MEVYEQPEVLGGESARQGHRPQLQDQVHRRGDHPSIQLFSHLQQPSFLGDEAGRAKATAIGSGRGGGAAPADVRRGPGRGGEVSELRRQQEQAAEHEEKVQGLRL